MKRHKRTDFFAEIERIEQVLSRLMDDTPVADIAAGSRCAGAQTWPGLLPSLPIMALARDATMISTH